MWLLCRERDQIQYRTCVLDKNNATCPTKDCYICRKSVECWLPLPHQSVYIPGFRHSLVSKGLLMEYKWKLESWHYKSTYMYAVDLPVYRQPLLRGYMYVTICMQQSCMWLHSYTTIRSRNIWWWSSRKCSFIHTCILDAAGGTTACMYIHTYCIKCNKWNCTIYHSSRCTLLQKLWTVSCMAWCLTSDFLPARCRS